jgi:hypothetical protein
MAMASVATLAVLWLFASRHGTLDWLGRPLGTDFSNVWTAGRMALDGRAALAWDWHAHHAAQQAAHGRADVPFYGWHYPPPFLLVAALLATLPYLPALALWQIAGIGAASVVARQILPRRETVLLVLGLPAGFVCLGHGQNGFLTASLLGGGLLLLDRRPWLAGALLGCLVYKPQFAPVLPLLLLAGGHWRALGGATLAATVLIAATTLLWGVEVWIAFLQSLPLTRTIVIEGANTGAEKIVTAFAAVRLNGGSVALAYRAQAVAIVLSIAAVVLTRSAPPRVRGAAVAAAALLATPYAFDYDLVVLGLAIALLAAEGREAGWRPWERTLLAFAWIAPLLGRAVGTLTGVPLGLLAILATLALAVGRAPRPALRSWPSRRSHAASAR